MRKWKRLSPTNVFCPVRSIKINHSQNVEQVFLSSSWSNSPQLLHNRRRSRWTWILKHIHAHLPWADYDYWWRLVADEMDKTVNRKCCSRQRNGFERVQFRQSADFERIRFFTQRNPKCPAWKRSLMKTGFCFRVRSEIHVPYNERGLYATFFSWMLLKKFLEISFEKKMYRLPLASWKPFWVQWYTKR